MSALKIALVAAVATVGLSSIASAENAGGANALLNGYTMYLRGDGEFFTMQVGAADHAKLMKMSHPVPMGGFIYRYGDKLYMVQDKKQGTSTMLHMDFPNLLSSY